MTIVLKQGMFSGLSKLFVRKAGLEEVIRGILIDNARSALDALATPALTDNTTGTGGASVVDLVLPSSAFDATAAGGASRTDFNTAVGKISNAHKVLTNSINRLRAGAGLAAITCAFGVEAVADTLPAQDKTTTAAVTGANALDYASGQTAMAKIKQNERKLVAALNDVLYAIGEATITDASLGSVAQGVVLSDPGTAAASATGASAVSKVVADAFLLAHANNLATIAAKWNAIFSAGITSTQALHAVAGRV